MPACAACTSRLWSNQERRYRVASRSRPGTSASSSVTSARNTRGNNRLNSGRVGARRRSPARTTPPTTPDLAHPRPPQLEPAAPAPRPEDEQPSALPRADLRPRRIVSPRRPTPQPAGQPASQSAGTNHPTRLWHSCGRPGRTTTVGTNALGQGSEPRAQRLEAHLAPLPTAPPADRTDRGPRLRRRPGRGRIPRRDRTRGRSP